MLAMSAESSKKETDSETHQSINELKSRSGLKRPRKKLPKTQTSSLSFSKSPTLSLAGKCARQCPESHCSPPLVPTEDVEMENYSQESVSMLQECYQQDEFPHLMETCANSELEELDIYTEEKIVNECTPLKVEHSTQTDFFSLQLNHSEEKEMMAHAKFVGSVVRLKTVLSSKKTVSDKELRRIINLGAGEEYRETDSQGQAVPKETVGYILRSSDADKVLNDTVRVLLQHLENVVKNDISKIMFCWKNSVYEIVVEMLSQAVDSEAGILKMVASFLREMIESILNDGEKSKNLILESKASIIVSFCQSTHLTFSIIDSVTEKLTALKAIKRNEYSSWVQKLSWAHLTRNSCFLLRILQSLLELIKSKFNRGEIIDAVVKKPEGKKCNILEMWRKQWGRSETEPEPEIDHNWEMRVSDWCDKLDDILLHCVSHLPVLSFAVERCGELAKEILKLCHPSKKKLIIGIQ